MNVHSSLSDQLKPAYERIVGTRPKIVPICQITGKLLGRDRMAAVAEARNQVLRWLSHPRRVGRLPEAAWSHGEFEVDMPGFRAEVIRIDTADVDYWISRFEHIDERVARTWSTEITVARQETHSVFGLRLVLSTREEQPDIPTSLPGIVKQIAETPGLCHWDGREIGKEPWVIADEDEVLDLVELIQSPSRKYPVIVVSLAEGVCDPASALLDASSLADQTVGLAQVAVLSGPLSFRLSDEVGKPFSVFRGAVRYYRPGCDFSADSPYAHPLVLPERIVGWGNQGPSAFLEHLMREAAFDSTMRINADRDLPSLSAVKQAALSSRRQVAAQQNGPSAEAFTLLEAENRTLRDDAEAATALAQGEEMARLKAEAWAREMEEENARLRWRVRMLTEEVEQKSGTPIDTNVPIPSSLGELRQWSEQHLTGRVAITSKAARAARKSSFKDVELAYRAVLVMANQYYQMRVNGGDEHRQALENALQSLGLRNERSGEECFLREQGDEFLVDWGRGKRLLDWHLKTPGNTRDPERCFRLYYFWDDETQQVVIGSMPDHLQTRAT